ncbi:MAG TPA: hypothetical protein VGE21_06685 [Flavobacteriales bacterium]
MRTLSIPCALFPLLLSAQFAPPGALWTYEYDLGAYTVGVVGDTLIDGHSCSTVQGSTLSPCWESTAFVYQEQDEVFFRTPELMEDFALLYKWDAQVGESWDIVIPETSFNTTLTYTVMATGTTEIDGEMRRTLTVQLHDSSGDSFAYTSGTLIEGIGDLHYLFPWVMPWCDPMFPGPLRCYTDDGIGTWMAPGITECMPPPPVNTVFAPAGAKWTYTQRYAFFPDSNLFVIENVGDTLILGRNCSKLAWIEGVNGCMPFHRYVTTSGDSVLYFSELAGTFEPLYIFRQPIGSTWLMRADFNATWGNGDTLIWTVLDTGHVVVDGATLATTQVSLDVWSEGFIGTLTSGTLIERLGDLRYLFPWIFAACDGEYNMPLRCYEDAQIAWVNPVVLQCELSVGIAEGRASPGRFLLATVLPAGSVLPLRTDLRADVLQVFDATGRTVAQRRGSDPAPIVLDRPGAYCVVLELQGTRQYQRVVVH